MTILQKTWTTRLNSRAIPSAPYDRDDMVAQASPEFLRTLKDGLVLGGWTVVASSNRTVADTNDNWNANTDVGRGGPAGGGSDTWPGSWVILKSPGFPVVYMLIDYTAAATYQSVVRWSEFPFDISNLSPYRVPEATGPEINNEWAITEPGSGTFEYYVTLVTADDGSFIYIGTTYQDVGDNNVLMFNRMRETHPLDLYPWVVWQKNSYTTNAVFAYPDHAACNMVFALAPDGTQLDCSFARPTMLTGTTGYDIVTISADDLLRNYRPFSWPVRVLTRTVGYEGFKGYLEDFWWAAAESGNQDNIRWMQPGFDGQDAVVCKRGCWWMPTTEQFRW